MNSARRLLPVGAFALVAACGATSAFADWTQRFELNDPFVIGWQTRAAGGPGVTDENVQFDTIRGALDGFVGLLGSRAGPLPPASTVAAFVSGTRTDDYAISATVNPDQRPASGWMGVVSRHDDLGAGIAALVDYSSGQLQIARVNVGANAFEILSATAIPNFANDKTYGVRLSVADDSAAAKVFDEAAGSPLLDFDPSAVVASVALSDIPRNPTSFNAAGLYVRAADETQPAQGTFGRTNLETMDKETGYLGRGGNWLVFQGEDNTVWSLDLGSTQRRFVGSVPANWKFIATADFNDDDRSDLVWHNPVTGEAGIWLSAIVNDETTPVWTPLPTLDPAAWELVGVGELTRDGLPDLVWRERANNMLWMWQMNRTSVEQAFPFFAVPSNWRVQVIADMNRDGDDDLVMRSSDGSNGIMLMDSYKLLEWRGLPWVDSEWKMVGAAQLPNPPARVNVGNISFVPAFGEVASNDLLWYNPRTRKLVSWEMNRTQYANFVDRGQMTAGFVPGN